MYNGILQSLENSVKNENVDIFNFYKKTSGSFEVLMNGKSQFFSDLDQLMILSFFHQSLTQEYDIFHVVSTKENVVFKASNFKERMFKMIIDYFKFRKIDNLSSVIALINLENKYKGINNIELHLFKTNIKLIEDIYTSPENNILETLKQLNNATKNYNNKYFHLIKLSGKSVPTVGASLHSKDGIMIRMCNSGEIKYHNNENILSTGQLLITRKVFLGDYQILTPNVEYLIIYISEDFLKDFYPPFLDKKINIHDYWKISEEHIKTLLDFNNFELINITLLEIAAKIFIDIKMEEKIILNEFRSNFNNDIFKYINQNISTNINVITLQKEFKLKKHHILKLFHEQFNIYPSDFILNKKLELVAKKLLNTDEKISNIASELYFSNSGALSTSFKTKYLMTPLVFRKTKLKELKDFKEESKKMESIWI